MIYPQYPIAASAVTMKKQINSSHFDKLDHAYKFTKEILNAKNNLVYSTHFGLSEGIRTFFQKFSK